MGSRQRPGEAGRTGSRERRPQGPADGHSAVFAPLLPAGVQGHLQAPVCRSDASYLLGWHRLPGLHPRINEAFTVLPPGSTICINYPQKV